MADTLARSAQPLPTTGRVASRVRGDHKVKLEKRLAPYQFNPAELPILANGRPVALEVGSGNGAALIHRAQQQPDTLHLAAELFLDGLKSTVHGLEQAQLSPERVRLWPQDARELLSNLPTESLQRLLVLHPDPWPKKRHHKRRLVQTAFLEEAARVLHPEGALLIATDWADYAHWCLAEVYRHGRFTLASKDPAALATPPTDWLKTKYQEKAEQAGRANWYLHFMLAKRG